MIKLNKKGFMMAEVIVVSAVIMTTLVSLYTSYNKIFSIYNQRVKYYDVTTLYELAFIRDNDMYEIDGNNVTLKDTSDLSNTNYNRKLFYVEKNEINNIDKSSINKTYQEYIEYLIESIDKDKTYQDNDGNEYEFNDIIIMERCKVSNNDDCTYAYLEIPIVIEDE